jgi:hypothetical protein
MLEMEIDQPPEWQLSSTWRELVLVACREQGGDELLDPQSNDLNEWEVLIDSLAGRVRSPLGRRLGGIARAFWIPIQERIGK